MKFWIQHYSCEPLNMSKWIYIWLDNLLHKTHITGKMKVPLSTKICFLSWTKKLRLQHCFSKSSLFLSSEWIYIWVYNLLYKTDITGKMKVSLSTKMNVPLCRKSLFFELDNEILAPVLLFETLNINKSVFIWLDNLLHKIHITGKMKVPLFTKICFLS